MKIQTLIFCLFVGKALAQNEIESVTGSLHLRHLHYGHRYTTDVATNSYRTHEQEETSNVRNNFGHKHHHFQHNAEWHRIHGIPIPDDVNHGERHHPFTHNPEWHRRHRMPMPGETNRNDFPHRHRNYSTSATTLSSTKSVLFTTPRTTRRTTTTPRSTTTTTSTTPTPSTSRRITTTADPEYSREIYDTKRQVEYDDIETFNNRVDP